MLYRLSRLIPMLWAPTAPLAKLPELEVFASEPVRGAAPPLVEGYDLLYQLKHGEHPFVSPGDHQALAETKLPFSFRTASYDSARSSLNAGQLPDADDVRVEDFIAAQDYDLPPATPSGLALQVAASDSPLNPTPASRAALRGGKLHLMSLALQGASYDSLPHRAHRLVVAIDSSAAMDAAARMSSVRRALAKLARHMGEDDRVTLVRFADTASVVAENLNRGDLASLVDSDSLSATDGVANLSSAIEAVAKVTRDMQSVEPRQVVVVSGDRGNYDAAELPNSASQLSQLAKMNVPWRIVRVNANPNDAHWEQLATEAHGKVAPAQSPDDVYQQMAEAMTRWPAKVARNVSVTLRLNPQTVAAYRLLGHEARTLSGLSAEPVEIDLGVDQTALGVYEMALQARIGRIDRLDQGGLAASVVGPAGANRASHRAQPICHFVLRGAVVAPTGGVGGQERGIAASLVVLAGDTAGGPRSRRGFARGREPGPAARFR